MVRFFDPETEAALPAERLTMADVTLSGIVKRVSALSLALDDVSLAIRDGEFFVLLGPSGAGKTTTLRVIAGLERQDRGNVLIDGRLMNARTPPERDVAFVFQQYSLYPTMSVYDNLAFPLALAAAPHAGSGDQAARRRRRPRSCASRTCWSARPRGSRAARCSAFRSAARSCATRRSF